MENFVATNCSYFDNASVPQASSESSKARKLSDSEYYSIQHYSTWKSFQEIVEQILNTFLENVGGNIETLKTALHEISSQPK